MGLQRFRITNSSTPTKNLQLESYLIFMIITKKKATYKVRLTWSIFQVKFKFMDLFRQWHILCFWQNCPYYNRGCGVHFFRNCGSVDQRSRYRSGGKIKLHKYITVTSYLNSIFYQLIMSQFYPVFGVFQFKVQCSKLGTFTVYHRIPCH